MCGRVVQASDPLRFAFVDGLDVPDSRAKPPSYNVAPSQLLYVIRENHETGQRTLELLRWGLIPHGCEDPEGGRKPINARAESVARLPTFRAAYAKRRCIVPVDCFFSERGNCVGKFKRLSSTERKRRHSIAHIGGRPGAHGGGWFWPRRHH
jgi:putative SOS response-associated peptidase YedK